MTYFLITFGLIAIFYPLLKYIFKSKHQKNIFKISIFIIFKTPNKYNLQGSQIKEYFLDKPTLAYKFLLIKNAYENHLIKSIPSVNVIYHDYVNETINIINQFKITSSEIIFKNLKEEKANIILDDFIKQYKELESKYMDE